MVSTQTKQQVSLVALFTMVSWLGMTLHNAYELPQLTILNSEVGIPTIIHFAAFAAWGLTPYKRLTAALLLVWALMNLMGGGILSVVPFPFLPFYPEQSVGHYLSHVIYSIAQLPLLWAIVQELRQP